MKNLFSIIVSLFLLVICCSTKDVLDSIKHDLQIINSYNFNTVINNFRNEKIFFVLFFKKTNNNIKKTIEQYNTTASDFKGIITFCVIDCDTSNNHSICENELSHYVPNYKKETDKHHILVYPINPMPQFLFNDDINVSNVKKYTYLIPSKIQMINDYNDVTQLLAKHENMPKVLIFSQKKKPNYVLNALSMGFNKKLLFGFVNNKQTEIVQKYKIKNIPSIIIIKNDKIIDTYKGKLTYMDMFDWLNIHSETFVMGGGFDTVTNKTVEKPWKFELVPKLTKLSYGDICFKKSDKGLCFIYLKEGDKLDKTETNMLLILKEKFKPNIDGRGVIFRFMWMDISFQANFKKLFDFKMYPTAVVFNPHKRIRYTKLDEDLTGTKENIERLLEKITGGDAKFTMLPEQKLPEFVEEKTDDSEINVEL
ncbi:conserved protein, unknown function [Hepatocystis sp. ex Piliocolobus tephrosceles]|nr:conserved protein, unknown function [Hepatocystis sp. ex Piliocolobus tephrosceles]